jgi:hypothetical protein
MTIDKIAPLTTDNCYAGSPWPDRGVTWLQIDLALVKYLRDIIETADDERPIQAHLAQHPVILAQLLRGGHGRWIFAKPRFGAEHVPDFALCEKDSAGYHWTLVELENPNFLPLTESGQQNAKLTHAMQQVSDWRIWLTGNIQYAQQEKGFIGLDNDFRAIVVIGRRQARSRQNEARYRELSSERVETMSYDRLLETIRASAHGHAALFARQS